MLMYFVIPLEFKVDIVPPTCTMMISEEEVEHT